MTPNSRGATASYVEHVAIRVRDIQWHIRFFLDVLGQDVREIDGPADDPRQYWTLGGLQLMAVPDFEALPSNNAGWLAHLGVMVDDLEAALAAAQPWGVTPLPQGRNWLQLPDGLALELIQAAPGSVAQALAVRPRG
jgi:catechol 2,3-dioxygenase-like lactoylglutathione lyase family enzyme